MVRIVCKPQAVFFGARTCSLQDALDLLHACKLHRARQHISEALKQPLDPTCHALVTPACTAVPPSRPLIWWTPYDSAHAHWGAWLQGQFQNAYPELMRLSSYRIAEVVEAPDGTCSVAVDVASGPEVGAKHAEHHP